MIGERWHFSIINLCLQLGAFVGGLSQTFGLVDAHSVQEYSLFLSLFSSFFPNVI